MNVFKKLLTKHVPPKYLIHAKALDYYFNGPGEIRYLRRLCDPRKTSIDVGANIGIYTYFMRRHSSSVIAYEPNPGLARLLNQTFDSNVSVKEAALSSEPGLLTLRIPTIAGIEYHGLASLSQDFSEAETVREIEVPVRRLDDEADKSIGFIKIDVEQHESEVLRGAMGLLSSQKPNLLIEVTPLLYDGGLIAFLSPILALGYRGFFLFENNLVELENYDPNIHAKRENLAHRRPLCR